MLQTHGTEVSELGPLMACSVLQSLWCRCESLPQQAQGLQAACPKLRISGEAIAAFGHAA